MRTHTFPSICKKVLPECKISTRLQNHDKMRSKTFNTPHLKSINKPSFARQKPSKSIPNPSKIYPRASTERHLRKESKTLKKVTSGIIDLGPHVNPKMRKSETKIHGQSLSEKLMCFDANCLKK